MFDSAEMLSTKLMAGGSGYDVVAPSVFFLHRDSPAGPARSAFPDEAHAFLNCLMETEVIAEVSNVVGQPNAVVSFQFACITSRGGTA